MELEHNISSPTGMIRASNFFELALATILGVLVELPITFILVKIENNTKEWFDKKEYIN